MPDEIFHSMCTDACSPDCQADLDREAGVAGQIRHDCAFCGRDRSAKDDNHAPECPYWDFFGRKLL